MFNWLQLSEEEAKLLIAGTKIISVVYPSQYIIWRVFPERSWEHQLRGVCVCVCVEL